MNKACSEMIVHSSNIEEEGSSEEEVGPLKLSGNQLKKSLKNISSFKAGKKD